VKIGITCHPTYGGSGAVATELGLKLAAGGHEVHFISYAQPFRLDAFHERVFFHEVETEQYPLFEHSPYSLSLAVTIHETAAKCDLDVFHAHYAIPHATSAWIAREMLLPGRDLPIVTTLHGTDITLVGIKPSFQPITRFSILRSQGLTAVSEFLREETVEGFGVPAERIKVIPNFIDTSRYRRGHDPRHREVFAPNNEKIVMHVSNFRPVKRVTDVVEVFACLLRSVSARLVMVGDGPERPRALERAEELGVEDRVLFLGKHVSVDELLSYCDLFVLPSESESFGLAALEAMACGAPVVASRVGGLPELVEEGESGHLLSMGDVEGMAAAAVAILADEATWSQMSASARETAVSRFEADKVVPMYEDLYREVVAGSRASVPAASEAR
jgi:N-acetyl-alpha-D-glucosaminyl L-malate synthase BshA